MLRVSVRQGEGCQERVTTGLAGGPLPQGPSGEALPLPHPRVASSSRNSRGGGE